MGVGGELTLELTATEQVEVWGSLVNRVDANSHGETATHDRK